jgi:colanic acid biosynthesis glycosyl transferase WcaI
MRILVISQYYWPENFRINDLTEGLVKRGHQVTVLTGIPNYPAGSIFSDYAYEPKKYNNYNGVDIIRVPIIPRGKSGFQLVLNYLSFVISSTIIGLYKLKQKNFDSIFVFEPSPVIVGLPAIAFRYFKKAPLIFWVLDLWPDTLEAVGVLRSKNILRLVGVLVSYIYKRCDLILGQSKSFIPHIRKYAGHNRVDYFPGWAESIFSVDQFRPPKIRSNSAKFNIVFAGNVGVSQDFPAVLKAMEQLKDDEKIGWTIVGDGRMSDWLETEVSKRGLNKNVRLAGRHPMDKMPGFFQDADALLVSLKDEPIFSMTIPGKLQAYLVTGKPILTLLNGEGANLIKESGCGIACDAGDWQCLVKSVQKLSQMNFQERDAMGRKGLLLTETEFDRDKLISKLEKWMQELASGQEDY